eukprot:3253093-Lingulodinium_polyedra.AAC.1
MHAVAPEPGRPGHPGSRGLVLVAEGRLGVVRAIWPLSVRPGKGHARADPSGAWPDAACRWP